MSLRAPSLFDLFSTPPVDPHFVSPEGIGKVAPSADPTAKHCSRMGAEDVATRSEFQRERLYNAYFLNGPMTDSEAADWLSLERSSIIPRRTELMDAGRVQKVGHRKNAATGISNTTWGLVKC